MLRYTYIHPLFLRGVYTIDIKTVAKMLTLYKDNKIYKMYSIAVGKPSTQTPKGVFAIINKAVNPGGP